ncbi:MULTISPECIES: hypothetical protein [unclassified Streptomyces]|uniref:DUF768 domain-containing protein n=1 Tax=Streptomyces johnsoniae TaxID=3075532 RepID=A0ABU2S2Z0_9ACTN|nr:MULTISPECIES: hypothetical protein [unclassified Streptomyces]MDT0443368.1 hypothetical protein [Streptomyces sp. DSM 41886]ONK12227.1 hypothetical protein STBA_29670 [Streptomyces sp. MP131-18]
MDDFIDAWTRRLLASAGGALDERTARGLVAEIYHAAALREVDAYEEGVARLEAEREE